MNKTVLLIGLLSVRRYPFDATHMLVKTTDTEHCGAVPKSAFK